MGKTHWVLMHSLPQSLLSAEEGLVNGKLDKRNKTVWIFLDWEARPTRFLLANYGGGDLEKAI